MAVRIDIEAFVEAIQPATREAATALWRAGAVTALEEADGGAQAVVRDGSSILQPWVGIVDGAFTGECECPGDDDLCVHAVAVALAAFDEDVRWSGAAVLPSLAEVPTERIRYATAVERLAPRQLAALVVDQAADDRLFATMLLRAAGMLDAADHDDAHRRFRLLVEEAAAVTSGSRWQIHELEAAGRRLAAEAAVLAELPATADALVLVEQAILVWDELAGYLIDAHEVSGIDPDEVGTPLTEAYADLFEQLNADPAELARRLRQLADKCDNGTVDLDVL
ncbi:SWIM zinc finger family protein [Micromonospora sp. CPCC 206061]|uniref:SWIM zinc finger family protein n=1 Tax=Micromonospora sp. CPCC 206061 TaxID=3122410 RepID=UPI002FF35DC8